MDRVEGDGLALFDYDIICGIVGIKWVIFFGSVVLGIILRILFIGGWMDDQDEVYVSVWIYFSSAEPVLV